MRSDRLGHFEYCIGCWHLGLSYLCDQSRELETTKSVLWLEQRLEARLAALAHPVPAVAAAQDQSCFALLLCHEVKRKTSWPLFRLSLTISSVRLCVHPCICLLAVDMRRLLKVIVSGDSYGACSGGCSCPWWQCAQASIMNVEACIRSSAAAVVSCHSQLQTSIGLTCPGASS